MGQLFSNLQMPGGGGTLSSHLYIILACMWASFMSAFHMHACMRAYFTTPWGKSKVLSAMGTWTSPSNWARNLHSLIYRFNLTLPVQFEHVDLPVRWRNQHVMLPWPTLPFSSWVKTVFTKSYGQPLLGGHKLEETHKWTMMFSEFWERFKNARGTSHDVFRRHADRLQFCCPIAIHGDEGRGKLKRAVMATSVQPLVVPNGHAGHSFNTRYLHSIMPERIVRRWHDSRDPTGCFGGRLAKSLWKWSACLLHAHVTQPCTGTFHVQWSCMWLMIVKLQNCIHTTWSAYMTLATLQGFSPRWHLFQTVLYTGRRERRLGISPCLGVNFCSCI